MRTAALLVLLSVAAPAFGGQQRSLAALAGTIVTSPVVLGTIPAAAQSKPNSPLGHRMDDGFLYAVIDFGYGAAPVQFELSSLLQTPARTFTALWIELQITNLAVRQLATPRYPSSTDAIDDAGNIYRIQHQSVRRVAAASGRHKPGESSLQLWVIPATEMIEGIAALKVILGDSGFGRSVKFFELASPQARHRDFNPEATLPDRQDLTVEARSAFLSPVPQR